jgi:delta8-fatty-acid desaturase
LQSVKEVPLWLEQLPDAATAPRLRTIAFRAVRLLTRVQHLTMAPVAMLVGRYNFVLISWVHAVQHRRWMDVSCMATHLAWFAAFLAILLPTARQRVLFVASHYALVGVLHVQLLLSHLCTQQFSAEEEASLGVFRFQLATTRNIQTCWWDSWFHGGLEKQIEHHLFPQLPRHRLHGAVPRVRSLAAKHGIPYMELPFSDAMLLCGRNLARLSVELATVNPLA